MFNLKDKKVLVTGASGGIGEAIVKIFSEAGAIVGLSARNEEKMKEIASKISAKTFIFKTDLSNEEETSQLIEKADAEMGGIDILICNAGITKDGLSMRMRTEDFKSVIDTNLTSTFILNRDMAKKMIKKRYGRIINMSSVVATTGNSGQVNYTASKAGMVAMTKSFALEYGARGITFNCIAPGFIATPMTDILNDEQKKAILAKVPVGELGKPEDIAYGALYLASDEARYITGQTLNINGGMLMV